MDFEIDTPKEVVVDALGEPHDKEVQKLKTKTKDIYYYYTDLEKKKYCTYIFENDKLVSYKK